MQSTFTTAPGPAAAAVVAPPPAPPKATPPCRALWQKVFGSAKRRHQLRRPYISNMDSPSTRSTKLSAPASGHTRTTFRTAAAAFCGGIRRVVRDLKSPTQKPDTALQSIPTSVVSWLLVRRALLARSRKRGPRTAVTRATRVCFRHNSRPSMANNDRQASVGSDNVDTAPSSSPPAARSTCAMACPSWVLSMHTDAIGD
jgi:hypothetical protein